MQGQVFSGSIHVWVDRWLQMGREILGLAKTNDAKYIWMPRSTKNGGKFFIYLLPASEFWSLVLRPPPPQHPWHPHILIRML